jgi:DNA polymerase-3 subunit gamma/tau
LSRCYKFYFQKLNSLELRKVLQRPIENENIKIDEESINKIIELSDGAARDALTILDQLYVYSNNNITPSVINNIFGLLDFNKIIELINNIVENKLNVLIKNIEQ